MQFWGNPGSNDPPRGSFRIFNDSAGAASLEQLELRYYFTNDETAALSFFCTYFNVYSPGYLPNSCANIQPAIVALVPSATNASSYVRLTFKAGTGSFPSGSRGDFEFYYQPGSGNSIQANDYSGIGHPTADPGSGSASGWDKVTLYRNGALVWGCEP